jgi:hypothetical protein
VIECVPVDRVEVDSVALPALRATVERTAVPFLNVTVPVGVPEVFAFTVAVNVTVWPCFDGLSDEVTPVVVPALFIVSVRTPEPLDAKFAVPP